MQKNQCTDCTYTARKSASAATTTPAVLIASLFGMTNLSFWFFHFFVWVLCFASISLFITQNNFGAQWRPAYRAGGRVRHGLGCKGDCFEIDGRLVCCAKQEVLF